MKVFACRSLHQRILGSAMLVALVFAVVQLNAQRAPSAGPELEEETNYYAVLHTSKGQIALELYPSAAPETVRNFVNLAEGQKDFIDPRDRERKRIPYYDTVIFHRVIPGFMIQAGDRTGTGMGGPGYNIADEFDPEYNFTEPYLLAMANTGRPNTGGAQFFITTGNSMPRHLNQRHTIFGRVVEGGDVVDAISNVPRGAQDRPNEEVVIRHAQIIRVPADAAADAWKQHVLDVDPDQPFDASKLLEVEAIEEAEATPEEPEAYAEPDAASEESAEESAEESEADPRFGDAAPLTP